MLSFHGPIIRRFHRCIFVVLAAATCLSGNAQVPETILMVKAQGHEQTGATSQRPAGAFFGVRVTFPNVRPPITSVRLRHPAGGDVALSDTPGFTYEFSREFETMAALDAAFPEGTYRLIVNAGTTSETEVQFSERETPAPVLITNFDALQEWLGPSPVVRWLSVSDAQVSDSLHFSITRRNGAEVFGFTLDPAGTEIGAINIPVATPLVGHLNFYRMRVTRASNRTAVAVGRGFQVSFPLRCVAAPVEFLAQPQGRVVRFGERTEIFATAEGQAPLSYQWKKNGVPIPGATGADGSNNERARVGAVLPFDSVQLADAGSYSLEVTNTAGTVGSDPAPVAVLPRLAATAYPAGSFGVGGGALACDRNGTLYFGDGSSIRSVSMEGVVRTLAANVFGSGISALAVDPSGTVYFTDTGNHIVRRVGPNQPVAIVAGAIGERGYVEGPGIAARFSFPSGIVADELGNLYVADSGNQAIRKITPSGIVSTVAGGGGSGFANGTGSSARFSAPDGIAISGDGSLFVMDQQGLAVRKISPAGQVTTFFAPRTGTRLNGIAADQLGNVFVGTGGSLDTILHLSPQGAPIGSGVFYNGNSTSRMVFIPRGLATNRDGALFASDANGIWKATTLPGSSDPGIGFVTPPQAHTIPTGGSFVLTTSATGPNVSYQWWKDGSIIPGATRNQLHLRETTVADAGDYHVLLSNGISTRLAAAGSITTSSTDDVGRMANLAIRSIAGTGAESLIVGMVVGGDRVSAGMGLLVRGIGPGLTTFGVSGALTDPTLTVMNGPQAIAANDNWDSTGSLASVFSSVGAFSLAPNSTDAASTITLSPGSYTLTLAGKEGATGIGLAEIYELPSAGSRTAPRVINLSTRTHVGTGSEVLIAGFAIGGQTSRTVLIRGVGPTLALFGVSGVLADPELKLFSGETLLASSDNWNSDFEMARVFASLGAFSLSSGGESALLITLPPGPYTAQVSGRGGGKGVALVEVYEVP